MRKQILFLINKLFRHEQCPAETRNIGKGISGAVYCSLLKYHNGPHRDYSGKRSWED